jgi:two-component system, OmpR family, response regulator
VTSKPQIAVVDDDREIRTLLCEFLNNNGYQAVGLVDGAALDRHLQRNTADLIVLDVMLPGEDGFSICRRLRDTSMVPIVMLTARDEDIDQILGLEVGADDYVRKPFNPRALLARIRAVLRRSEPEATTPPVRRAASFRFADWRLDTTARRLIREDGSGLALNGAEFDLLILLLAEPQRVRSRQELSQLLHGRDNDPADRSIDVRVSRLRQRLGDTARPPTIIKTVYGGGYVMGVPVLGEPARDVPLPT